MILEVAKCNFFCHGAIGVKISFFRDSASCGDSILIGYTKLLSAGFEGTNTCL